MTTTEAFEELRKALSELGEAIIEALPAWLTGLPGWLLKKILKGVEWLEKITTR